MGFCIIAHFSYGAFLGQTGFLSHFGPRQNGSNRNEHPIPAKIPNYNQKRLAPGCNWGFLPELGVRFGLNRFVVGQSDLYCAITF